MKASANDVKRLNNLVPKVGIVREILDETPDVKTFRISTPEGEKPFSPMPGQLGMYSMPAVGEAMFSVTSQGPDYIDMAIKKTGVLTEALHAMEVGQEVGIRGPYGNGFPIEQLKGRDITFIAGGIGLAPVRSLILYCLEHRADFGKINIIYGGRSKDDLCFKKDLFENWANLEDANVYVTIDRPQEGWDGHVGFVPSYVNELNLSLDKTILMCGPPIMIKFTLQNLQALGFERTQVYTTMELRMKCGIGKCGRCNVGAKYVCKDGPVFRCDELSELPDEY